MTEKTQKVLKLIVFLLILAGVILLTVKLFPWFMSLSNETVRNEFKAQLDSLGVGGWFIMVGLQMVQIVIAFIPGEPIEILAGVMYGTVGGLLTCMLGVLIASTLVFFLVRKFGYSFLKLFVKEEKIKELGFLQNTKRLELITFILFFIPGTPKDVLTYVAGITPIHPVKFLSIAVFARIPSIVTSTLAGSSISTGNWLMTGIVLLVTGIIAVVGILINNKLMARLNEKHPKAMKASSPEKEENISDHTADGHSSKKDRSSISKFSDKFGKGPLL